MDVRISGVVDGISESHTSHGKQYYKFLLRSKRLSGTYDCIPIIISEDKVPKKDSHIHLSGQLRTRTTEDNHLEIYVYGGFVGNYDGEYDINKVIGLAKLFKKKTARITPESNRKIIDCLLESDKSRIPTIAWQHNAEYLDNCETGGNFFIIGRLQSREYTKVIENTTEIRTAYELSVSDIKEVTTNA